MFAKQWRPDDRGDDPGGGRTGEQDHGLGQQQPHRDPGNAFCPRRLDLMSVRRCHRPGPIRYPTPRTVTT
jgi:hypothetical protein